MEERFRMSGRVAWLATVVLSAAVFSVVFPAASVAGDAERDTTYVEGGGGGECGAAVTDGDDRVNGYCGPVEAYDVGEFFSTVDGVANRCRRVRQHLTFKALATGVNIWRYVQEVEWCWNGVRVTRVQRDRYAQLFDPGSWYWDFKGHTYSSCMAYADYSPCTEKKGLFNPYIATQGKFQACIWKGCWTKMPGLYMNINANGRVTSYGTF